MHMTSRKHQDDADNSSSWVYQRNHKFYMKHTKHRIQAVHLSTQPLRLELGWLTEERKRRWEEIIRSTALTHNSRKVLKTIKNLFNNHTTPTPSCQVNSNHIAHQLLINSRGTMSSKHLY